MIIHNNTVYEAASLGGGLFTGFVPKADISQGLPTMKWNGGKISYQQWCQMLAFFRHTNENGNSESQVRLFYNESLQHWRIGPLPQRFPSGMTTKELPAHEDYERRKSALMDGGFDQMGTSHHHCSAGAFQSGTDSSDEGKSCGLHITVGDMGKEMHSLHLRVVVLVPGSLDENGKVTRAAASVQYDADPLDWFAFPADTTLPEWFPKELQRQALLHALCVNTNDSEGFPPDWKATLIEAPKHTTQPHPFMQQGWRGATYTPNNHKPVGFANGMAAKTGDDDYDADWDKYWEEQAAADTKPVTVDEIEEAELDEVFEEIHELRQKHGISYMQAKAVLMSDTSEHHLLTDTEDKFLSEVWSMIDGRNLPIFHPSDYVEEFLI